MVESELAEIELPEFGVPDDQPTLSAETYRDRMDRLRERAGRRFDAFVVYADREHFANLAYLTGYDPRFEEALLIVDLTGGRKPVLLVGNEGAGYAQTSPVSDALSIIRFQSFSLLGQDRTESDSLETLLRDAGVDESADVGVAGWKHFTEAEFEDPGSVLEIPSYLARTIRELVSDGGSVRNGNEILMDSDGGMRARSSDVDQLAYFEFAAAHTSQAIRNVLFKLQPGMTEYEAVERMAVNGTPQSCHLMLSTGERAQHGLPSPSPRIIERGDPFTTAYGVWGALNSRAGFVVDGAGGLPRDIEDYVDRLVKPYFEAVVAWYERVGVGVRGETLYNAIHDRIGDPFFGVELNPGHLIHLDEWVDSPVYEGSTEELESGMAVQVDVIPATGTEYFMTNIEDGILLADGDLRAEFAAAYPDAWERIQRRRRFMIDRLGIDIGEDVLPLSNIPAYLPPFLLSPETALKTV
jgi:hypothetical protein